MLAQTGRQNIVFNGFSVPEWHGDLMKNNHTHSWVKFAHIHKILKLNVDCIDKLIDFVWAYCYNLRMFCPISEFACDTWLLLLVLGFFVLISIALFCFAVRIIYRLYKKENVSIGEKVFLIAYFLWFFWYFFDYIKKSPVTNYNLPEVERQ